MSLEIILLDAGKPLEAETFGIRQLPRYSAPDPLVARNLGSAFANIARDRTSHAAVVTKASTFSYSWLFRAAEQVREHLRRRSTYAAGTRIALQLSNSAEYLAAFYGVLLADCVVVPLPLSLEKSRKQKIIELCQPALLISRLEDFNLQSEPYPITTLRLSETASNEISFSPPHRQDSDLAMLMFTSGSMGMPKGVMLSHRNLLANAASILHELPINADDRSLPALPFCHAFGNSVLQTHVLAGATLLIEPDFKFPSSTIESLRELEATSFSAVPEVYGMLLKYGRLGEKPLPTLKYMTVAGGELREDVAAEIARRTAPASFYLMYGQSEATARLAILPFEQSQLRRKSIGKPVRGVQLAILDEKDREVPPRIVGMLCARGDNVMLGYFQDSASTAEVLTEGGWLRTGDLGHRDEEGFFYLDGRASLLVKIQGHRVHPAEIESLVEERFPESAAVAIPTTQGESTRFVLFIAPRAAQAVDIGKVRAMCHAELPSYKVPVRYQLLDQFPLTSGYKVDREALRLMLPKMKAQIDAVHGQ